MSEIGSTLPFRSRAPSFCATARLNRDRVTYVSSKQSNRCDRESRRLIISTNTVLSQCKVIRLLRYRLFRTKVFTETALLQSCSPPDRSAYASRRCTGETEPVQYDGTSWRVSIARRIIGFYQSPSRAKTRLSAARCICVPFGSALSIRCAAHISRILVHRIRSLLSFLSALPVLRFWVTVAGIRSRTRISIWH